MGILYKLSSYSYIYFALLWISKKCVPPVLNINKSTFFLFPMILGVNMGYFLKQREHTNPCNGGVWCCVCGTGYLIKGYHSAPSVTAGKFAILINLHCPKAYHRPDNLLHILDYHRKHP